MYVAVQHDIRDTAAFRTRGQPMTESPPAGIRALQFFPNGPGSRAVCLWSGPSIDEVRDHIDGSLGDASRNEYFAVDEEHALGLPATV